MIIIKLLILFIVMSNFIGGKQASELLGVHQRTLMNWDKIGKIETIRTSGNKRLYNVSKFITENTCTNNVCENLDELDSSNNKLKICYIRVSSVSQKDDLERQKELMVKNYPNHVIIEEIGSGLNLNKRGIKKLIYLIIDGKVEELVVAYRDRLTRFGFELFEDLIKKYSNGKLIVLNEKEKMEPEEELVKDMMSIMNVYVAKMNGLRKYSINKKEKKLIL
jgi:predicted site-specific integrase-resolvase